MEYIIYKENYKVYRDGRIYGLQRNRWLKPNVNSKSNYHQISLKVNGNRETWYIHRLVATLYIPNPKSKRTVNHKDGNKSNNSVDNLEWMTHSENHKHAYEHLNRKPNVNVEHLRNWASKASNIRWSKVQDQKNTD